MNYAKTKENIITIAIPAITAILLGVLQFLGKEYLTPIILIGIGSVLLLILLYLAIRFLEDREKRWKKNKEQHTLFEEKIIKLENSDEKILDLLKTNEKINILEERMSYLEGRIKK